jgi:hypothetical protein
VAFLRFLDRLELFPGQRQSDLRRRGPFQDLTHRIDLVHVLRRELAHRSAAVAPALDQAEALELDESLAQHMALGAEALSELLFDQPRAGREPPEDDLFLQRGDEIVLHQKARFISGSPR